MLRTCKSSQTKRNKKENWLKINRNTDIINVWSWTTALRTNEFVSANIVLIKNAVQSKNKRGLRFSLKEEIDLAIFISTGKTFHTLTIRWKKESLKVDVRSITFCLRYIPAVARRVRPEQKCMCTRMWASFPPKVHCRVGAVLVN